LAVDVVIGLEATKDPTVGAVRRKSLKVLELLGVGKIEPIEAKAEITGLIMVLMVIEVLTLD
jgi:hypothetical protein